MSIFINRDIGDLPEDEPGRRMSPTLGEQTTKPKETTPEPPIKNSPGTQPIPPETRRGNK